MITVLPLLLFILVSSSLSHNPYPHPYYLLSLEMLTLTTCNLLFGDVRQMIILISTGAPFMQKLSKSSGVRTLSLVICFFNLASFDFDHDRLF